MALVPVEGSELESTAVEIARHAGLMLHGRFGRALQVNYKDKEKQDPVTSADTECQAYLCEAITARFPDHGIVAEETEPEAEQEVEATSPRLLVGIGPSRWYYQLPQRAPGVRSVDRGVVPRHARGCGPLHTLGR